MSNKVDRICECGTPYQAKLADIKRGWGNSCGKKCAAKKRERANKPEPSAQTLAACQPSRRSLSEIRRSNYGQRQEPEIHQYEDNHYSNEDYFDKND